MIPITTRRSSAITPWRRWTTTLDLTLIAVLFLMIGLWYAGPMFQAHFSNAIPAGSTGGSVGHMIPGDQYEAYYRHTLPFYNLKRGHWPLYSGYEYALNQQHVFVDGMIYLPFALLVSFMAMAIGPIAAFNSMAILSFSLCGMTGYLLGRELTNSRLAGLVAATVVALLPFRIGFLFGEMFYATDMALLPLALFFFIRLLRTPHWKYAASFSVVIFLLATSNFALLYWTCLLFGPFFMGGYAYVAYSSERDWEKLGAIIFATALPMVATAIYVLHVKGVLNSSGLASGQKIDEVRFYSPSLIDLITRWNGIEKTVYTGLAGVLALLGIFCIPLFRKRHSNSVLFTTVLYSGAIFVVSYVLALGLTFDDATGIPLYRAVFEYVPFANASRTPGRLMPIVGVCAAILASVFTSEFIHRLRDVRARTFLVMIFVSLIVFDFRFSNVSMTILEQKNGSYQAIHGARDSALAIPFEREADNYKGTTYQYFALVNNIRMVNGHSSTFPSNWSKFYSGAKSLNYGAATRSLLQNLRRRGVRYIVAHETSYEPHVSAFVVALLDANPALRRMHEDSGIVLYEIVDPDLAPQYFDGDTFSKIVSQSTSLASAYSFASFPGDVEELSGWYDREAYPNQKPFRWMAGTSSVLFVAPGSQSHLKELKFSFKCPSGKLKVSGTDLQTVIDPVDKDGWEKSVIRLSRQAPSIVTLTAPSIYTVPTDPRRFGCMISDFVIQ